MATLRWASHELLRTVQPYSLTLSRPLMWATYSRLRSLSVVIVCMDAQLSHCVLTKLGIRSRQPDVWLTCKRTGELTASRPPQSEVSYVKEYLCAHVQGARERCPAQGQAWMSCQAQRHVFCRRAGRGAMHARKAKAWRKLCHHIP